MMYALQSSRSRNCWKVCSFYRLQSSNFHSSPRADKSVSDEDYQFLHRSDVHSMHFQKSLLRLPIPELPKTCERYLRSQKAIQTESAYVATTKLVKEFESGIGIQLQAALKSMDKSNKHTSYISDPWFDMYLSDRSPVVLNYNPFFAFHPDERPGYGDPITRATNILVSSMRFMKTLRHSVLEPEVFHLNPAKSKTQLFHRVTKWSPSAIASYAAYAFKAFPLDMSQFKNLFNSTRIPEVGKDRIAAFPEAKHILFMKNGNYFVFDIFDKDGNILPPSHIHACVKYIYNDQTPPPKHPVSILTGGDRDMWAIMRKELLAAGNGDTLHLIDSAGFNIVFDDTLTKVTPEEDVSGLGVDVDKLYKLFIYGDGKNRWFDKSFSLIFTSEGLAGVNFEHAWGDGVAVMRYFNEVAKDNVEKSFVSSDSVPSNIDPSQYVRKLSFNVPESVAAAISDSLEDYNSRTKPLCMSYFESDALNRGICKKHKLSPDAVMQLGFQLAYELMEGRQVGTYESCSTAAFRHGRTETLRPATLETTAFSKAASRQGVKSPALKAKLKEILHRCSSVHANLTKEAAMGQGFDRHLFGLRKMAERERLPLPPLYDDPAFASLNYHILSTSTLPSTEIVLGGFAPVVRDGFGIGYRMEDQRYGLVVSTYEPHRNGSDFVQCAQKAYQIIHDVLV